MIRIILIFVGCEDPEEDEDLFEFWTADATFSVQVLRNMDSSLLQGATVSVSYDNGKLILNSSGDQVKTTNSEGIATFTVTVENPGTAPSSIPINYEVSVISFVTVESSTKIELIDTPKGTYGNRHHYAKGSKTIIVYLIPK